MRRPSTACPHSMPSFPRNDCPVIAGPAVCNGLCLQESMHELHARRAFSHRGRDAFDTARTRVTHRKNTRVVRLEKIRLSSQRPLQLILIAPQIGSGTNESFSIELNTALQPSRVWYRTHHEEYV